MLYQNLRRALNEYHVAIILDPKNIGGYDALASVLSGVTDESSLGPGVSGGSACEHLKDGYRLHQTDEYGTAARKLNTILHESPQCLIEPTAN